jgi:hypothetical protein
MSTYIFSIEERTSFKMYLGIGGKTLSTENSLRTLIVSRLIRKYFNIMYVRQFMNFILKNQI